MKSLEKTSFRPRPGSRIEPGPIKPSTAPISTPAPTGSENIPMQQSSSEKPRVLLGFERDHVRRIVNAIKIDREMGSNDRSRLQKSELTNTKLIGGEEGWGRLPRLVVPGADGTATSAERRPTAAD